MAFTLFHSCDGLLSLFKSPKRYRFTHDCHIYNVQMYISNFIGFELLGWLRIYNIRHIRLSVYHRMLTHQLSNLILIIIWSDVAAWLTLISLPHLWWIDAFSLALKGCSISVPVPYRYGPKLVIIMPTDGLPSAMLGHQQPQCWLKFGHTIIQVSNFINEIFTPCGGEID